MRQRIANALSIEVEGAELTGAVRLEFYVRQGCLFLQYTPQVVDDARLLVQIPYEDAMRLRAGQQALLQLAFTDADGNRQASDVVSAPVRDLLKEAGYD